MMVVVVGPYVWGQRAMALLAKVCEWMLLPCRACSAVLLSVLLATDPVTSPAATPLRSIQPHHPLVSGLPSVLPSSGPQKSYELPPHSLCLHPNLPLLPLSPGAMCQFFSYSYQLSC